MKLAVDMASILKTCLAAGKDPEGKEVEFEGSTSFINSAMYAYENSINSMKGALDEFGLSPIDLIMVTEGMHSKSRRKAIYAQYKESRAARPPEYYEEYQKLQELVRSQLCALGAIEATQPYVEGDDILSFLAENSEEDLIIMSNDGDMTALNGVNKHGKTIRVRINGETGRNKYGGFPHHLVTTYKALVGDSSDSIKGCPGFGPAKFLEFISLYGEDGLQELHNLLSEGSLMPLEQLAEDNNCKILRKIFDERESVLRSFAVAKLYPNWCDTLDNALEWNAGMVVKLPMPDERLSHWQGQKRLVGAANYEPALAFLKAKLPESPFVSFDIETSTPDETDDWLERAGKPDGVDVIGSYLCGFSITFGANNQYTYYVSVKHASSDNITMKQAREMIEAMFGKEIVIQNTNFELVVLANAEDEDGSKWVDLWQKYGQQGYMPGVLDTKLEASYVNENIKLGLKERSKLHLGYEQETYEQVTTIDGVKYKMHELTAQHVFNYGCDDTICTAALHNFYKLHMQLEHCYETYKEVEIGAAYLHAHSFLTGVKISISRIAELDAEDKVTYEAAWAKLCKYLIEQGWDGTVAPKYTPAITAKEIKDAYRIVVGIEEPEVGPEDSEDGEDGAEEAAVDLPKDPVLSSRVRTPSKLVDLIEAEGHEVLAALLREALESQEGADKLTAFVLTKFSGLPNFKASNKQMNVLLYEVMQVPIRVRNKPTKKMQAAGIREGTPKSDALALAYAVRECTPEQAEVIESIKLVGMVKKRQSDFYNKYPKLVHWKTGRVHSSHNQSSTNTRRASSSGPNLQQLPKHAKIEGQPAKFREVFIPHKQGAVIVSLDFSAQELRVIAERSQDQAMLDCYVGESLKDMHALTGLGILQRTEPQEGWTYESMQLALKNTSHEKHKQAKDARTLGKKCNFTTEFGAAAPKLAQTLLVTEAEAQMYIDAKEEAFSRSGEWKQEVIKYAQQEGKVYTLLGAPRHLRDALKSSDRYIASKADRQAVNFSVQGSAAEMTKLAEGRMWSASLFKKFDAEYISPIHDECVASVSLSDLPEFIKAMHVCMVAPYATMRLPIESSISFGPNFGTQIEIGDKPADEAINKGLEELNDIS